MPRRQSVVLCLLFWCSAGLRPALQPRRVVVRMGAADDGYDAWGTLLRQGPVPFLKRVSEPDKYEMSVQNYMAKERCSRSEAQGNMDAFNANEQDWTYQKMQEKKGAPKFDYGKPPSTQRTVLTLAWAAIVVGLATKIALFGY